MSGPVVGHHLSPPVWDRNRVRGRYRAGVRQRHLETATRRVAPVSLSGVTPGATGTSGHGTARDRLRSAAGRRAHDETGRAALPHSNGPQLLWLPE